MSHFIRKCSKCKTVILQCRCIGPHDIQWALCGNCDVPNSAPTPTPGRTAEERAIAFANCVERNVGLTIKQYDFIRNRVYSLILREKENREQALTQAAEIARNWPNQCLNCADEIAEKIESLKSEPREPHV